MSHHPWLHGGCWRRFRIDTVEKSCTQSAAFSTTADTIRDIKVLETIKEGKTIYSTAQ
jgi:hypothetical protein